MQVILLERIAKLGQMGDEVRVKDGYARNFLLPRHKALRANEANRKKFEGQRAQLEARNLELKSEAERVGETIDGKVLVLVRQAGETGQLYGSVSTRDVAEALTKDGASVARNQVVLNAPIKTIGLHVLPIQLHPEVEVSVTVNVARSEAEAERQAQGEDLTKREEGPAFETFSEDDDDRRGRRSDRDDQAEYFEETDGQTGEETAA
ncbi:50S ribosomal protein L9 [Chelatococcus sambhunathii]|uniref:Large ribosomal subunit protein bL9 n=1 Tax=Chelatococcus sambhunathii TaxID=363953 RepID=A0ABU1DAD8_9HYPH|nr:50S ribosomal protein L9 [Chelatococcus sambhunathii]MDR4305088.1 50S ribosomal protein L9 [Chelatococcus sambhunathii]